MKHNSRHKQIHQHFSRIPDWIPSGAGIHVLFIAHSASARAFFRKLFMSYLVVCYLLNDLTEWETLEQTVQVLCVTDSRPSCSAHFVVVFLSQVNAMYVGAVANQGSPRCSNTLKICTFYTCWSSRVK